MMAAQRNSAPGQSEAFLTSMVENMPAVVFAKDSATCRFILLNRASEIPRHSVRCHYRQDRPRFLSQGEGRRFIARDRRALQSRLPQAVEEEPQARLRLGFSRNWQPRVRPYRDG
jgi:hypothetical protein